jgi:hypothetical protein
MVTTSEGGSGLPSPDVSADGAFTLTIPGADLPGRTFTLYAQDMVTYTTVSIAITVV